MAVTVFLIGILLLQLHCLVIASWTAAASTTGSSIGGWQEKLLQTNANDLLPRRLGRFGMVSANAGGKFWATASLSVRRTTDRFARYNGMVALNNASALSSSPMTTTCVCGLASHVAAMP